MTVVFPSPLKIVNFLHSSTPVMTHPCSWLYSTLEACDSTVTAAWRSTAFF